MQDNEPGEGENTSSYLQEACYYLRKKGLSFHEVSEALEIPEEEAIRFQKQYEAKIATGVVRENEVDKNLWEDIYHDALGDEKVTFARDNGFYHCRKSDLEEMESTALMAIFESSRKFLDFDIYKPYLNSKPPVGFDPMALQRQVKRAVELIQVILEKRWVKDGRKD